MIQKKFYYIIGVVPLSTILLYLTTRYKFSLFFYIILSIIWKSFITLWREINNKGKTKVTIPGCDLNFTSMTVYNVNEKDFFYDMFIEVVYIL